MKVMFTLAFALSATALNAAQPCRVDASCGNAAYPYRVVYSATGQNVLGTCQDTFHTVMERYRGLVEIGQCTASAPQVCKIDAACGNSAYPYRVTYANGENVLGNCQESAETVMHRFWGLRETGQCAPGTPEACQIDAACGNSAYPYRVIYTGNGQNVLGNCQDSFDSAMVRFRLLRSTGQCL